MSTSVWVVESGEGEQRSIDGIYSSLEQAVTGIQWPYGSPEMVWEAPQTADGKHFTLRARFRSLGLQWDITKGELDERGDTARPPRAGGVTVIIRPAQPQTDY